MSVATGRYAAPPGPPPTARYAPPPGAPPLPTSNSSTNKPTSINSRAPLLPTASLISLPSLAFRGWEPLDLSNPVYSDLLAAFTHLFSISTQFFELPAESPHKTEFAATNGQRASEEGFYCITGEKQIVTARSASRSPEPIREAVKQAWDATGKLMQTVIRDIARSLGLSEDVFDEMVEPCIVFPEEKPTPTLLRMFRYDRPGEEEGFKPKVVSEKHRDLGFLSLVIGHSPGLDVFEPPSPDAPEGRWVSIEDQPHSTSESDFHDGKKTLTASLLVGTTMAFLTRNRYTPGIHRVLVHPSPSTPYRFSLVFALRPFPAPVYTANFESDLTGKFEGKDVIEGELASGLFGRIAKSHFNVNIEHGIREEQRRKLAEAVREAKMEGLGVEAWKDEGGQMAI